MSATTSVTTVTHASGQGRDSLPRKKEQAASFTGLPTDMFLAIVDFASGPKELRKLSLVCKAFREHNNPESQFAHQFILDRIPAMIRVPTDLWLPKGRMNVNGIVEVLGPGALESGMFSDEELVTLATPRDLYEKVASLAELTTVVGMVVGIRNAMQHISRTSR